MNRAAIIAAVAIAMAIPDACCATEGLADIETSISSPPTVQWRMLGPALSRHFSDKYSLRPSAGSIPVPGTACTTANQLTADELEQAGLPTDQCSALPKPSSGRFAATVVQCTDAGSKQVNWHTGGVSGSMLVSPCQEVTLLRRARWQQFNPSLGIERSVRDGDTLTGVFVGYAKDSYDKPSFMVGASRRWTIGDVASTRIEAGLQGGLWWRSEMHYDSNVYMPMPPGVNYQYGDWGYVPHLVKRVVPLIVPMLTVEHKSGFGLRIAFAPALKVFGQVANAVPTLMVQTSYRL